MGYKLPSRIGFGKFIGEHMIVRFIKSLLCWHRWKFEDLVFLPRRMDHWGFETDGSAVRERCSKCHSRRDVWV